ncbi:MAG: VOC family protein [Bacteroidales bacterium]|nr:VOC family protein [Candidatus Colicola equi]
MKHLNEISHIGYAVRDIEKTAQLYINGGWTMSEVYEETVQNTRIAFLYKPGMTTIELVSPRDGESPVDNILKNQGVAPYHICYVVEDIMQAMEDLYEEGFKPLFFPVESIAMDNHKICYLYHNDIGAIEIVEK